MRKLYTTGLAVTAGAVVASVGGAMAVSAATSTSTPPPTAAKAKGARHGLIRLPKVVAEVVSDSSTGGADGKGQLVVKAPNGTTMTLSITPGTKAWKYVGPGQKPVQESATSLPANEVVIVAGRGLYGKKHLARHILDLGFQATSVTG